MSQTFREGGDLSQIASFHSSVYVCVVVACNWASQQTVIQVLLPHFQTRKLKCIEIKQTPENAQLMSNRIRMSTGFSTCTKAHRHEGHTDREGQNPDPREPLYHRVLGVEGILVIHPVSLLIQYKIIFHLYIYLLIKCLVRAFCVTDTVLYFGEIKVKTNKQTYVWVLLDFQTLLRRQILTMSSCNNSRQHLNSVYQVLGIVHHMYIY